MIREMLTHAVDESGNCVRCNRQIPPTTRGAKQGSVRTTPEGHLLVGMTVADFGGTHTYFVGEHDSNPACTK